MALPLSVPATPPLRDFVASLRDHCATQAEDRPHTDLAQFAAVVRDLCATFLETE